jgi:hypothetical protein
MSAKKQRTPKSSEKFVEKPKYASRYVEALLDQLIAGRLRTCRYPKAVSRTALKDDQSYLDGKSFLQTDKWLKKVKINLLRKLSEQSRTVFRRGNVPARCDQLYFKILTTFCCAGPSVEQLRDEVLDLTRRIEDQQQHIRELLDREGRASSTALVARPASL